jgi:photoactive yellow protein
MSSTSLDPLEIDSSERLATMTPDEVNALPYGFLILDRDGVVQLYNRYESDMSRLAQDRVVGRNWFREVAPCTRVEAFFGRFRRVVDDPDVGTERFSFRFHFLHGSQDVIVGMTRAPGEDGSVFLTVVRREVSAGGPLLRSRTLTADEELGVVVGPLGPALPLPAGAFAKLVSAVAPAEARALGADIGRSLAALAEQEASELGEDEGLSAAPALLRSGVLDAVVARSGFGRLAVDLTAYAERRSIGVTLRPPTTTPTPGLAFFYEGLLASALQAAVGQELIARCLDIRDTVVSPWVFAVVPADLGAQLDDVDRVPAQVMAGRLGLGILADE